MTLVVLLVTGLVVFLKLSAWVLLPVNVAVLVGASMLSLKMPRAVVVNRRVQLAGSRFSPPSPA